MKATISLNENNYTIDLSKPLDISINLNHESARAWYQNPVSISPVKENGFIGQVSEGGSVNFNNIYFNPHAHGTHTECLGHISETFYSINRTLDKYFFKALLISVVPTEIDSDIGSFKAGDQVITDDLLKNLVIPKHTDALIIRTLPNKEEKTTKNYSETNPPYLDPLAIERITSMGINHLLIDLPSIDREVDQGQLLAHKAFWEYPSNPRQKRTITEFIFVKNTIHDGNYMLELQVAPFDNDASPSRPVLYSIRNDER